MSIKRTNGYSQVKNHAKQDRKRREAYARQDEHDKLSIEDKIAKATSRGGSVRELARLRKTYVKQLDVTPPKATTTATVEVKVKKPAYQKPKKS
jgi:hypothetical protein